MGMEEIYGLSLPKLYAGNAAVLMVGRPMKGEKPTGNAIHGATTNRKVAMA